MTPGDDERPPAEGRIVEQTSEAAASMRRGDENYQRAMRVLDDEYVRQSFIRSWTPEVRRLRRLLREAA